MKELAFVLAGAAFLVLVWFARRERRQDAVRLAPKVAAWRRAAAELGLVFAEPDHPSRPQRMGGSIDGHDVEVEEHVRGSERNTWLAVRFARPMDAGLCIRPRSTGIGPGAGDDVASVYELSDGLARELADDVRVALLRPLPPVAYFHRADSTSATCALRAPTDDTRVLVDTVRWLLALVCALEA